MYGPVRSKPCVRDPFPLGTDLDWGVREGHSDALCECPHRSPTGSGRQEGEQHFLGPFDPRQVALPIFTLDLGTCVHLHSRSSGCCQKARHVDYLLSVPAPVARGQAWGIPHRWASLRGRGFLALSTHRWPCLCQKTSKQTTKQEQNSSATNNN